MTMTLLYISSILFSENEPTITYFQPNDKYFFTDSTFSITSSNGYLEWKMNSKLNDVAYLRQNIGLLYVNGKFSSYYSDWKQNTSKLHFEKRYNIQTTAKVEAIGLHYGEFHDDGEIYSIQQMDHAAYYLSNLINSDQTIYWKDKLDQRLQKEYFRYVQNIFSHFSLEEEAYTVVLLTSLDDYIKSNFSHFTKQQTEKLVGLLWESIYKQYMVPLFLQEKNSNDFMPALLFANDGSHLYIIYQLNNEWHQYMQQLPTHS